MELELELAFLKNLEPFKIVTEAGALQYLVSLDTRNEVLSQIIVAMKISILYLSALQIKYWKQEIMKQTTHNDITQLTTPDCQKHMPKEGILPWTP